VSLSESHTLLDVTGWIGSFVPFTTTGIEGMLRPMDLTANDGVGK